jgi:serine/threonine-protein kinase
MIHRRSSEVGDAAARPGVLWAGRGRAGIRAAPLLSTTVAFVLAAGTPAARAQSGDDRKLAESLFREGRALMAERRWKEACPKLQESWRLDPAGGALLNLAACHEAEGRTATAWLEFNEALSLAKRDGRADRMKAAADRIAALEPTLSRLTVRVAPQPGATGLEVRVDDVPLRPAAWGVAVPIDPGAHAVTASALERKAWRTELDIGASPESRVVDVPVLEIDATPLPPVGSASAAPSAPAPPAASPAAPRPQAPVERSSQKTVGYVVGGAGIAALAVGGYFGVRAIQKRADSDAQCPGEACTLDGYELNREAKSAALVSDIGFGVGLAGLAAGLVLVLTAPSEGGTPQASAEARRMPGFALRGVAAPGGGWLAVGTAW